MTSPSPRLLLAQRDLRFTNGSAGMAGIFVVSSTYEYAPSEARSRIILPKLVLFTPAGLDIKFTICIIILRVSQRQFHALFVFNNSQAHSSACCSALRSIHIESSAGAHAVGLGFRYGGCLPGNRRALGTRLFGPSGFQHNRGMDVRVQTPSLWRDFVHQAGVAERLRHRVVPRRYG